MRRASAVAHLVRCRRLLLDEIAASPSGDIEYESERMDGIDRLLVAVRAGRVRQFEVTHSPYSEIHVTD